VIVSPLIAKGSYPSTPQELWEVAHIVRAQWADPVITRSSWLTVVQTSRSLAEQRRSLAGRPTLGTEVTYQTMMSRDETIRLETMAFKQGVARYNAPIISDRARVTWWDGSHMLTLEGEHKRFYGDRRIILFNMSTQAMELRTITTLIPIGSGLINITVDTPPTIWPVGSSDRPLIAFPTFEAAMSLDQGIDALTPHHVSGRWEATENPSTVSLPPAEVPGAVTAGIPTHSDGLPILFWHPDWSRGATARFGRWGSYSRSGITRVPSVYGNRPRVSYTFTMRFMDRAVWSLFRQFWDSRAGRTFPFWILSPLGDYEFKGFTAGGIKVGLTGNEEDWQFRPYIGLERRGQADYQIRPIDSINRVSDGDVINVLDPLTQWTDVRRVASARLVRFASDELEEQWMTDTIVDIPITVTEVTNEIEVDIPNVSEPPVVVNGPGWDPCFTGYC
jgi:hypothetical protein